MWSLLMSGFSVDVCIRMELLPGPADGLQATVHQVVSATVSLLCSLSLSSEICILPWVPALFSITLSWLLSCRQTFFSRVKSRVLERSRRECDWFINMTFAQNPSSYFHSFLPFTARCCGGSFLLPYHLVINRSTLSEMNRFSEDQLDTVHHARWSHRAPARACTPTPVGLVCFRFLKQSRAKMINKN